MPRYKMTNGNERENTVCIKYKIFNNETYQQGSKTIKEICSIVFVQ